jgi:hypothetical protein
MSLPNVNNQDLKSKSENDRIPSVGGLSLPELDLAIVECEKDIKKHSEIVKLMLSTSSRISPSALRELSKARTRKFRLTLRRITLLIESGDTTAAGLIDRLLQISPNSSAQK